MRKKILFSLVFSTLLRNPLIAYIRQQKQNLSNKNNTERENAGRINYDNKVGDKVLLAKGN